MFEKNKEYFDWRIKSMAEFHNLSEDELIKYCGSREELEDAILSDLFSSFFGERDIKFVL